MRHASLRESKSIEEHNANILAIDVISKVMLRFVIMAVIVYIIIDITPVIETYLNSRPIIEYHNQYDVNYQIDKMYTGERRKTL